MSVIAFDVNETLKRWFNQFFQISFLAGITGHYVCTPMSGLRWIASAASPLSH